MDEDRAAVRACGTDLAERLSAHDALVLEGGLGVRARRDALERLAAIPVDGSCLVLVTGQ